MFTNIVVEFSSRGSNSTFQMRVEEMTRTVNKAIRYICRSVQKDDPPPLMVFCMLLAALLASFSVLSILSTRNIRRTLNSRPPVSESGTPRYPRT